ncbi:hypothetical protein FIV00_14940 [Labrenzia sp. THAF82]|uniref:type VI secretion system-associated protein TagO n=1 Tax=Labrenzia sp. THAF82 TaxID=2587861 RepID=UPI001268EDF3|nr:type VI secretion system-associated protein TagO [Labrenzia sp. THAF82]QFT31786.1 hypothetical protein FIV00_14940 [Labrenzia sp. THAF82]
MKFVSALLAAVCALSGPAMAADDLASCVEIRSDKHRLVCYDRIAGYKAAGKGATTEKNENWRENWTREMDTSKFDDSPKVTLINTSREPFQALIGQARVSLVIQCEENTTMLAFHMGGQTVSDRSAPVEIRFDKDPADAITMERSADFEFLALFGYARSKRMLDRMMAADTMLMRYIGRRGAMTGEFDVTGLEEAIKPLREACNW